MKGGVPGLTFEFSIIGQINDEFCCSIILTIGAFAHFSMAVVIESKVLEHAFEQSVVRREEASMVGVKCLAQKKKDARQ